MAKQFNTNMLTPGETFSIRGKVDFSRISSPIMGDELREAIQRAMASNNIPIESPHTKLALVDVQVVPQNPNALTPGEQYIMERFYQKTKGEDAGRIAYTAVRKARVGEEAKAIPRIGVRNGNMVDEVVLEKGQELAKGLDVTLVFRVYATSMKNGISFDCIIVNEPIRFYSSDAALASMGLTWNAYSPAPARQPISAPVIPQVTPQTAMPQQMPMNQQPTQTQVPNNQFAPQYQPQAQNYPMQNANPVIPQQQAQPVQNLPFAQATPQAAMPQQMPMNQPTNQMAQQQMPMANQMPVAPGVPVQAETSQFANAFQNAFSYAQPQPQQDKPDHGTFNPAAGLSTPFGA